jgi:asparagine synthase (glutamine-hydrolysing)
LPANQGVIDIIAHRGPDGEGWRCEDSPAGPITLGHRRLAIISVDESGAQPMAYGQGRYWIVYNGEVYNYKELRVELEGLGHRFAGDSDTEVLLAAYAQWGGDCLGRLNGMFAFAIHDRQEQVLFLARDRFGVKPLYIWQADDGVAFCSEIKQLTALPGFQARVNVRRAVDFLASGLCDHTDETLFAGVRQLRGGECVRLDLGRWRPGMEVPRRSWYALPRADSLSLPAEQAYEKFFALLRDSVSLRLRADVPVGSCLSGGLDSSAIVCLVHDLLGDSETARRHAFSCCFDVPGLDEKTYVDAVIAQTHAVSHIVSPAPDDLWAALDKLVWHQDEPFGSTSIFAQWTVFAEAARAGIKVMLDGQGADEQLAGYHTMFGAHLAGFRAPWRWPALVSEMRAIQARHRTPLKRLLGLTLAAALPAPAFAMAARVANSNPMPSWLGPALQAGAGQTKQAHFRARPLPGESPLGALCTQQLLVTSVPTLLRYEDRNSMAHSIEARVPFLDYRLVELSIALGGEHKIAGGETKRLLRGGLEKTLPALVRNRQDKLGFPTPEELWFKGPLRSRVAPLVQNVARRFPDYFDGAQLSRWADDVLAGKVPYNNGLWRVISFGLWADAFSVSA